MVVKLLGSSVALEPGDIVVVVGNVIVDIVVVVVVRFPGASEIRKK